MRVNFIYFILLSATILWHTNAYAQILDNSIVEFNQFFLNYDNLNSANQDSSALRIVAGNRTYRGLFEGVNRLYTSGSIRINHKSETQYSNVGVLVQRFNDGPFINRTRMYARYAWTGKLGMRSSLSGGVAFGGVNYFFSSSQMGGGGSATALDANAGIWYLRPQLKIGLSYNQFVYSVLKPVRQSFILMPYWNVNLIYVVNFTSQIYLTNHFYLYHSRYNSSYQVAPIFNVYHYVQAGINYQHLKGVAIIFGIKNIPIVNGNLEILGSFFLRTQNIATSADNVIEIGAGYSF